LLFTALIARPSAAFGKKHSALLVRAEGLEPPRLSSREPKDQPGN
jgi:hypothetical protein